MKIHNLLNTVSCEFSLIFTFDIFSNKFNCLLTIIIIIIIVNIYLKSYNRA